MIIAAKVIKKTDIVVFFMKINVVFVKLLQTP